jgi:hypothetical protein
VIRRWGDLWAVALLAVASTVVFEADVSSGALRVIAGILLVLVLPGYALGRALFPRRSPGGPERILISLALSAAVAVLGAPLMGSTPLSLTRHTWPALLCVVTLAGCLLAWRAGRDAPIRVVGWTLPRARDVALLATAIAVASGAIALARTPLDAPDGVSGYTELWMVPRGDKLELGVGSAELEPRTYRLEVTADGRSVRRWKAIRLEPGDRWVTTLPAAIGGAPKSVDAYLYRLDKPKDLYRRVRVRPVSPGAAP